MVSVVLSEESARELRRLHGRRIRESREALGLTQADVAGAIGVIQQTVASWEAGRTAVSDPFKVALARVLNLPAAKLFPLTASVLQTYGIVKQW